MEDEVKEKPKRTPVRVVATKGGSSLVEWGERRAYVPASSVKGGAVSDLTLSRGIPYGVPWDDLAEGLAAKMHLQGLWTVADLAANARLSLEIAKRYKLSLGDLNRFAHKEGS